MRSAVLVCTVMLNVLQPATPSSLRRRPQVPLMVFQNPETIPTTTLTTKDEFPKQKPICGPVPFGDLSCEMPTTCYKKVYPPYLEILHQNEDPQVICNTVLLPGYSRLNALRTTKDLPPMLYPEDTMKVSSRGTPRTTPLTMSQFVTKPLLMRTPGQRFGTRRFLSSFLTKQSLPLDNSPSQEDLFIKLL